MVFPLSRGFSPLSGVRVLPPVVAFLHYGVLWYFPFMLAFLHCVVWRYFPSVVAFLHYVVLWYFPSVVAFLQNLACWYFPSVVAFLHHVVLRYFPFMCDGSFPFPVWQHSLIEKKPKKLSPSVNFPLKSLETFIGKWDHEKSVSAFCKGYILILAPIHPFQKMTCQRRSM